MAFDSDPSLSLPFFVPAAAVVVVVVASASAAVVAFRARRRAMSFLVWKMVGWAMGWGLAKQRLRSCGCACAARGQGLGEAQDKGQAQGQVLQFPTATLSGFKQGTK